MNIEFIKKEHNNYRQLYESEIQWLIDEVERTRARESTANMLVELTQKETANRCAEIADDYLDGSEVGEAIRNEFNIPAV
jgi:hypothetical protein